MTRRFAIHFNCEFLKPIYFQAEYKTGLLIVEKFKNDEYYDHFIIDGPQLSFGDEPTEEGEEYDDEN